jgi:membrane protease YdiL (CAAX protease family)
MMQETENSSVSWTILDVLLFLALWLAAQVVCVAIAFALSPMPPLEPDESMTMTATISTEEKEKDHGHPIFQMIEQGKDSPIILLVAFLAVVVAAPIIEEFLFRLLFQGWLETKIRPYQAIAVVSLFFASLHARDSGAIDAQVLFYMFGSMTVASLFVFVLGIVYLAWFRNVKLTPCLFGKGRFFHSHFFIYAGYCLLALIFIFAVKAVLMNTYPDANTNPIPIFLFSIVLGILYYQTKNLSYCILLHAFLNATSLAIVWFTVAYSLD